MTRNEYKHSTARLILLLVQFAVLCYSIFGGDKVAAILAVMLLPMWGLSVGTWLKEDE